MLGRQIHKMSQMDQIYQMHEIDKTRQDNPNQFSKKIYLKTSKHTYKKRVELMRLNLIRTIDTQLNRYHKIRLDEYMHRIELFLRTRHLIAHPTPATPASIPDRCQATVSFSASRSQDPHSSSNPGAAGRLNSWFMMLVIPSIENPTWQQNPEVNML